MANPVALVTGGAGGIGRATCARLLDLGYSVGMVDTNKAFGDKAVEELVKKNAAFKGRIIFLECDVTNAKNLRETFEKVKSTFGNRLDVVFNNAGLFNEGMWEEMVEINLTAVIRGTYLAINMMSKANGGNGGVVVNTGSMAGIIPRILPAYSATKFGVVGFSQCFREIPGFTEKHGVRVNCVSPAKVATPLTTQDFAVPGAQEKPDSLPGLAELSSTKDAIWSASIREKGQIPPDTLARMVCDIIKNKEWDGRVLTINDGDKDYALYDNPYVKY